MTFGGAEDFFYLDFMALQDNYTSFEQGKLKVGGKMEFLEKKIPDHPQEELL